MKDWREERWTKQKKVNSSVSFQAHFLNTQALYNGLKGLQESDR